MLLRRTTPRTSSHRRASLAAGAIVAGLTLVGCAEPELAVGDASVKAEKAGENPSADPSSTSTVVPEPTVVVDPELEQSFGSVGVFRLQLPLGWAQLDGMDGAASSATSMAAGAATYTGVPAQGKDQAAWVAEFMAGTSDVIEAKEGMTQQAAVTTATGLEMFHLVQNYADNRAHVFGFVADDTLHLLRFGLDGTPATAAVVLKAVGTAWQGPAVPAATTEPAPAAVTPTPTTVVPSTTP